MKNNLRLFPLKIPAFLSFSKILIFFSTFILLNFAVIFGQNLTVRQIMAEPSLAGMRPESEKISPDGKKVIFAWNEKGVEPRNLYMWTGGEPKILVNAEQNFELRQQPPESKLNYGLELRDEFVKSREKNLGGVEFSPDSKRILFLQNTDIYVLELNSNEAKPRRITRTQGVESSARWLTNESILFSSSGNFFVINIKETSLIQVTKEANLPAFISIFNANPTTDGKMLAYVVSDGSRQRALFVPNYLPEYTTAPTTRRGWTDQKIYATQTDGSLETPYEIKLPKADGVSYIRSIKWAADNASLIVDRVDKDTKRRQLFYVHNVGSKAEKLILLTEETDNKWIAGLSRIVEPNPKNPAEIIFGSEQSGFNHLYLASLEKMASDSNANSEPRQEAKIVYKDSVSVKQLTNGNFEVDFAKWLQNGEKIIFSSTEKTTTERQFYVVDSKTNKKESVPSAENGMKNDSQLSTDSDFLIFKGSKWNQPSELYYQRICPDCRGLNMAEKITNSTPESFTKYPWAEPKFIDIPSRDGKLIKSKLYFPNSFDKAKKHPMIIFVHGAGYLQNTINGWNNYYREFMFNTMLTQKGYVVLDIDYRGSAGYGRDWRTDVHDFLGGKDYEDHLDAIDYAVKNYNVDPKNVGVYGGSYGGFMTGMLVMRSPDKIAAGAALRSVFDWKNYYASSNIYTTERLGFPDKNPEAYKRSSPIAYADKLQKPLLILHGMADDNVHAQDSIQLIEKLMRLEKTNYFDAMLYPAENHGFVRPTSWADEYERIYNFFEKNLKN